MEDRIRYNLCFNTTIGKFNIKKNICFCGLNIKLTKMRNVLQEQFFIMNNNNNKNNTARLRSRWMEQEHIPYIRKLKVSLKTQRERETTVCMLKCREKRCPIFINTKGENLVELEANSHHSSLVNHNAD